MIAVVPVARIALEASQLCASEAMLSKGMNPACQSGRGPPADGSGVAVAQLPQEVQHGLTILEDIGQAQKNLRMPQMTCHLQLK